MSQLYRQGRYDCLYDLMSNLITKTTELAMAITLEYVRVGDIVIDATCGTGRDTVTLARAVGADGKVHAFDIQKSALEITGTRVLECDPDNDELQVELHEDSFCNMGSYLPENSAAAAVFNLGYLPGGDKSITTTAETTVEGLEQALRIIKPGGIVTVVMYDGHEAGTEEKARVMEWAGDLDPAKYHAAYVNLINQKNHPPEIMWITKKK